MILRSRQRRFRQVAALASLALAAITAGCQSTDGVVWRTGFPQPADVAQRQAQPPVRRLPPPPTIPPTITPSIRPGHSLDVDRDADANNGKNVRLVAASQADSDAEPEQEAAFGQQSLPGYPIPPPPAPLRDGPESAGDVNSTTTGSQNGRPLPIGFGFLRRSVSGEERDPTSGDSAARDVMAKAAAVRTATDDEPKSPKLASPFSLRRLYEKLRPKKSETGGAAAGDRKSETSTRVCEYNELNPAAPDGSATPVFLGLPDINAGDNAPLVGQHRSAVTQACPSSFQQPLFADPTNIEEYTPQ